MKLLFFCIFFVICQSWTLPNTQSEIQFKKLFVEPKTNKLLANLVPRITKGTEAVPHSIPYQVYIVTSINEGAGWACGGSLISPRHVLTAAHCLIDGVFTRVVLGAHNVQETEETQVVVRSYNLIPHSEYHSNTISNDIGLVVLDEPVELNEYIDVVQLPKRNQSTDYEGENARVSGWGRLSKEGDPSPVLMEVNVTVISNEQCKDVYSIVIDSQMCTSGEGGLGTCSGDSGGPLVVGDTQVGIVSYGASGCPEGYPAGYTRIASYLDWIEENSGLIIQ